MDYGQVSDSLLLITTLGGALPCHFAMSGQLVTVAALFPPGCFLSS